MDAYAKFYRDQKDRLFAYLLRKTGDYALAADATQEAFKRHLERYGDANGGTALLYAIARNYLTDVVRRRRREAPLEQDDRIDGGDQEREHLIREEYRRVLKAMERLAEDERDILALVVGDNLSYREIAEIVGTSEANVKVKVHRARKKLREWL